MQTKKLRQKDGTEITVLIMENKTILHNWDGPARIPEGNKKLAEYYIHGVQYSKEKWEELRKERNGLPWFKNPSFKGETRI